MQNMEMEAFSDADLQPSPQDCLKYRNHMVLKQIQNCPPISAFTTLTGQMIAASEMDTTCLGCAMELEPGPEKLWLDPEGHLVLGVKEEVRRTLSTRRSCIVRSYTTQVIGRVIIKTSAGEQNNTIQDPDYRTIAKFERMNPLFHSMTTSFKLQDGQEVGRMKHKAKGKRVLIEFTESCPTELKILMMAAAVLYQRRDIVTHGPFPEGRAARAESRRASVSATWLDKMKATSI